MRQRATAQERIDLVEGLSQQINDTLEYLELGASENDEAAIQEAEQQLPQLVDKMRAAELARSQYSSGLIDFQTVLDAERALLSAQDQVAQSKGQVSSNLISLYKALGGGWTPVVGIPP